MRMFMVGGCVRDEILGIRSKDIDFAVVLQPGSYADPYQWMIDSLEADGFKLFRDNDGKVIGSEHFTARGQFPKDHPVYGRMAADFVLARREGSYSDGRHPDWVSPGSLADDLARRDFTVNAIAKDPITGALIDPHNGVLDIQRKVIRAVGDPLERLSEDPLRALRAIRFAVTKGFRIDPNLADAMREDSVALGIIDKVADERIADELSKMMQHDSLASVLLLAQIPVLTAAIFQGRVSLDSSLKTKGRKHK